jgi:hypothetical protein
VGFPWREKAGPSGLAAAIVIGVWAHALSAVTAVALGAWSSRVISATAGIAVCVLAGGSVLAIVVGLGSPLRWLAPPLDAVAKATGQGPTAGGVIGLTVWAMVWAAVVAGGYWRLRLRRV